MECKYFERDGKQVRGKERKTKGMSWELHVEALHYSSWSLREEGKCGKQESMDWVMQILIN